MTDDPHKRIDALEAQVNALSKQNAELKRILIGDAELMEFDAVDRSFHSRVAENESDIGHLRTDIVDLENKWETIGGPDRDGESPDDRAMKIRERLYRKAKSNNGAARMTRDEVEGLLDVSLHRESLLDAMRRAAEGDDGKVNGSSRLNPVPGVRMVTGNSSKQSRIEMDTSETAGVDVERLMTVPDGRNEMTTDQTSG